MINEDNVLMRSVDKNGNPIIMYPATKKDNVIDLEEASASESGLMSPSDKKNLDEMKEIVDKLSYVLGSDENGIYIECIKSNEQ